MSLKKNTTVAVVYETKMEYIIPNNRVVGI